MSETIALSSPNGKSLDYQAKENNFTSIDILKQSPISFSNDKILKYSKTDQNFMKNEAKRRCKILQFTSEWQFDEIIEELDDLDRKVYPILFLFIFEIGNSDSFVENEATNGAKRRKVDTIGIEKIEQILKLISKFGENRSTIVQISYFEENETQIYYKGDNSKDFERFHAVPNKTSKIINFPTFLYSFMNIKQENGDHGNKSDTLNFEIFANTLAENFQTIQDLAIILKFLRIFDISEKLLEKIFLKVAEIGTKNELLAILDEPFISTTQITNVDAEKYLSTLIYLNNDEKELILENRVKLEDDASESSEDTGEEDSILHAAVKYSNIKIIDFLITHCTHLIQQLPQFHQIEISTNAFQNGQLGILCDLIEFSDFPFPNGVKLHEVVDERLYNIGKVRLEMHEAVETENFESISEFCYGNLKILYNPTNTSIMSQALKSRKFKVYFHLKSLGFQSPEFSSFQEGLEEIIKAEFESIKDPKQTQELIQTELKTQLSLANKCANMQRAQNINRSLKNVNESILLLSARSFIHNRKTDKQKVAEYHQKIEEWYTKIYNSKFGAELLQVVAQCEGLKIIFDFECDVADNVDMYSTYSEGTTYMFRKWIIIGAKYTCETRELEILGVIAHEMCHYGLRLVFENQEQPYFSQKDEKFEKFSKVANDIVNLYGWKYKQFDGLDDGCCRIISRVFILYKNKDHHAELIVRVPQIYVRFGHDEDALEEIIKKYKDLFDFYETFVVPEMKKFNLKKRQDVRNLNEIPEIFKSNCYENFEFSNEKGVESLVTSPKITLIASNISKFFMINMRKCLKEEYGNTFDARNLFITAKSLENKETCNNLERILIQNPELKVIFDFSGDNNHKNQIFNKTNELIIKNKSGHVFVIRNECMEVENSSKFMAHQDVKDKLIQILKIQNHMEINYNWMDLSGNTQEILLSSKINFQNNEKYSLLDLFSQPNNMVGTQKQSLDESNQKPNFNQFSNIIDTQLLNMLVEKNEISIHKVIGNESTNDNFNILFKQRRFLKKPDNSGLSQKSLILETQCDKYVLLSDNAGTGKSWAMRNLTNVLKDENPTKWISFVDLKQYIDKFKEIKHVNSGIDKNNHDMKALDEEDTDMAWNYDENEAVESDVDDCYATKPFEFGMESNSDSEDNSKPKESKKDVLNGRTNSIKTFETFFINQISSLDSNFESKIFTNLYNNGKVIILFDGFDEIAPNCAEFVLELIKSFESNGGNQIWIATREFFEIDLKVNLGLTNSYKLDIFQEKDGIDLMTEIWVLNDLKRQNVVKSKKDFQNSLKSNKKFEIYQKKAQSLRSKLSKISFGGIGLPLLFKMITKVFKDEADFKEDLTLYELFDRCGNTYYYERWSHQKGEIRKSANTRSQKFKLNFIKFHQFRAMEIFFPKKSKFCDLEADNKEWSAAEAVECGLVTLIDGKFYFIHRTFAEFYAANFIARILKSNEIEDVFEFFKEVIKVVGLRVIRMFLNDAFNELSFLKKLDEKATKLGVKCKENIKDVEDFYGIFTDNLKKLEVLGRFFNLILKNGSYDHVKSCLVRNVMHIIRNYKEMSPKKQRERAKTLQLEASQLENDILQENGSLTSKNSEIMPDQVNGLSTSNGESSTFPQGYGKLNEIFQNIVESALDSDVFEYLATKLVEKLDLQYIRNAIEFNDFWRGNMIQTLCLSRNADASKIQNYFETFLKFLTIDGFVKMLKNCNRESESILQVCVDLEDMDKMKFLWTEIEKFLASKGFGEKFKELVLEKTAGHKPKTIFHLTFKCDNIKFHEEFWKLIFETFTNREELMMVLTKVDEHDGLSFINQLIKRNKLKVIERTFKIFKKNFTSTQYRDILNSKDSWDRNVLQFAISDSKNFQKFQIVWEVFKSSFQAKENFLEFLQEDDNKRMNVLHYAACESTSEFFEFMITDLEKFSTRSEIRMLLSNLNKERRYLLQSAARFNKKLEIHECLWKIMKKFFNLSELIKFIKHCDHGGKNLILTAIEENTKETFELTWKEVLNVINWSDFSRKEDISSQMRQLDAEIRKALWFKTIDKESDRMRLRLNWIEIKNSLLSQMHLEEFEDQINKGSFDDSEMLAACTDLNFHKKFWTNMKEKFENREDLKNQIISKDIENNNFVHRLVMQNLPEIIEYTFKEFMNIFSHVQMLEIIKSQNHEERNLLQIAARYSTSLKTHQILWKCLKDSCKSEEMYLKVLKDVDYYKRDIIFAAACDSTGEIFEFMIQELTSFASHEEIKRILSNWDAALRNMLQSAARWNFDLKLHETLWTTFRMYFNPEDFFNFIEHCDNDGNNIMLNVVEENTKEIFELTWKEVRRFMKRDEQVKYLKQKGKNGMNLIELSSKNHENPEVHKTVVELFDIYGLNCENGS